MTMLLRTSDEAQRRILSRVGAAAVSVVVVAVGAYFTVNPFRGERRDVISVAIETPYAGQGVSSGTPVIMHGAKVGEITDISSLPGGGVRLQTALQSNPIAGLTDDLGIDFRPANYFGVTGINLIPAQTGQPLRDGSQIVVTPKGNFTLQALLYRLGEITGHVVNQRLISVIERATRYTDALNPLLETLITVSTTVTNVQSVSTAQLLRNATGINVAIPGLFDALIGTGDLYLKANIGMGADGNGFDPEANLRENPYIQYYDELMATRYDEARRTLATNPDDFVHGRFQEWLNGAETDLFAKVGKLESSHIYDLFPVVEQMRVMADVVPVLVPADDIAYTVGELRSRLERMYGGSGDQRALQVRVILEQLPGVAGPVELALGAAE
ncbi:MCE family protein [Mycolicibacterium fortuitum]|uniref:MCE family protein n=1 Tax=Mycolicibacterium fortuitum TaxID=1766 RepID=UPI000A4C1DCD|nr:MCE family protein [Mycolicibacterium fortuitum]